jgi:hypothetical protein
MQEKNILRSICLLSCAKNGYISIKKTEKKLGWSKQKIICVGNLLVENGVLKKDRYTDHNGDPHIDGYYIASF